MVASKELARRLYDRLREHAQDLGGADALEGILDLLEKRHGRGRASGSSTRPTTTGRSSLREIVGARQRA